MLQFTIDEDLCHGCNECVDDCPAGIIALGVDGFPGILPEREEECLRCQHCLAVCPEGALSILGKSPANSLSLTPTGFPTFEQMSRFVRGRRSIRRYRQENVAPELVNELLTTLSYSPTGVNVCLLTFTVIDDIDTMHDFQDKVIAAFRAAGGRGILPGRYSRMGELSDDTLRQRLFRQAPHAIVASAPSTAPCAVEDVAIAIAYFDLLAQSAGLGSVWWGFLRLLSQMLPEVKQFIGIPEDHVFSAALFGYPAVQYARMVQRDDAATIRRV